MKFHIFGDSENSKLILLHGVQTPWQIWNYQIDYFSREYHVIVPALNGHEEDDKSEYISLEQEAKHIEEYFIANYGEEVFAVCGISMGGAIALKLWESEKLKIHKLIMDGAPLVPYGRILTNMMIKEYLKITHRSQKRNTKTLENFKKKFLPEQYLDSYLRIVDNMSDETIKNIVKSISQNKMTHNMKASGEGILYIHGTTINEILSKRSAKLLRKYYKQATIVRCKGCSHCYKAIYEAEEWIKIVESFLNN